MDRREEFTETLARAKTLSQLGWKLNDKIEVRWLIERDGQPIAEKKWWGARLLEQDSEEPKIVTLLYDAVDEFEESRNRVLFLNEGTLYDIEEGAETPYRREGDLIDSTDYEKEQSEIVTFGELLQETPEEDGTTEAEIQKLPHEMQIQVAERFEQFKSGFIDFLREKTAERGSDALIDANDIADFVSRMKDEGSKSS